MFPIFTDEDINSKEDIQKMAEILQNKRKKKLKLQEDEENHLKILELQKQEKEFYIQNDIRIKFENNELSLTEEQIKENKLKMKNEKIELKKSVIVENIIEEKQYLDLKEYWEKYKIWRIERHEEKTGKPYSRASQTRLNKSFELLLNYLEVENYNICDFNSRFFSELQEEYKKIPASYSKNKDLKDKTLKEVIEINKDKKYKPIINKTINDYFLDYEIFFKYLNNKHIYNNTIFNFFMPLIKQKTESWERFEDEEIKLLFNNDLKIKDIKQIQDFIKTGLYSGMRINELTQLEKNDIIEINGIYCFNIIENLEKCKRLKTKGSIRIIPIHSKILSMILERKQKSKTDFIFFNGLLDSNSGRINTDYIRLLIENNKKVFHSTRKNFDNRLQKFDEYANIVDLLMGHGKGDSDMRTLYSGGSNELSTIEKRKKVIELLEYEMI